MYIRFASGAQEATTHALNQAIATLGETGLQATAIYQGTMVVNAVAGIADVSTGGLVTPDTLFPGFSMSKGVTATIVHRLVERGVLAYDEPLARWWPAFAAHGKGGISVRHALSHRTGLQTFKNLDRSEYPSLDATGRNLAPLPQEATPLLICASLRPDYAPGASMGYHGMTFGTFLGKVPHPIAPSPPHVDTLRFRARPAYHSRRCCMKRSPGPWASPTCTAGFRTCQPSPTGLLPCCRVASRTAPPGWWK